MSNPLPLGKYRLNPQWDIPPIKMAKIKDSNNTKFCSGYREIRSLVRCWECKLVQPLEKTVWQYLKKLNIDLSYATPAPNARSVHRFSQLNAGCARLFVHELGCIWVPCVESPSQLTLLIMCPSFPFTSYHTQDCEFLLLCSLLSGCDLRWPPPARAWSRAWVPSWRLSPDRGQPDPSH